MKTASGSWRIRTPDPFSRGGGLAIEMWRAEDDDVAIAESQLQASVFDQLAAEPQLDSTDLRVDVDRHTVILSGTVKTVAERFAAECAAKRLRGVERVQNDILVVRALSPQR
jgi:hypothetical protein